MGIRSEIKDVIKLYSGCIVDHHAALRAISEIVNRPKPPKPEQTAEDEIVERIAQAFEANSTGECLTDFDIFIIAK